MVKIPKDTKKKGIHPLLFVVVLMVILLVVSVSRFLTPHITSVETARFMNNAEAAYSIIHDDLCSEEAYGIISLAAPMATSRRINFGTAAIVSRCVDGGDSLWDQIQGIVNNGHEILVHSWNHGAPVNLGWQPEAWSNDTDVILAKSVLERNLNTDINWFIFPYDAYSDSRIAEIKAAGFLGARAGKEMYEDRGVNGMLNDFDPLRTNFDIYMSQEEQEAIHNSDDSYDVSIYPNTGYSVALQHIDAAIAISGWSVQEIHTVAPASDSIWGSITQEAYRELLDYCVMKRDSGELWIETPSVVASYIMTRNHRGTPELQKGKLVYPAAQKDSPYSSPLTTIVRTKGSPRTLIATIDGKEHRISEYKRNQFIVTTTPGQIVAFKLKK